MIQKIVLFLCTGNSCRSQMAEAIVNSHLNGEWIAFSAGTKPVGIVHPLTIQVLAELGIEHQGRSKGVDEVRDIPFDLVISVCDSAAQECPAWLGTGKRMHVSFPDPAVVPGSDQERVAAFRAVRDAIAREIPTRLNRVTDQDNSPGY